MQSVMVRACHPSTYEDCQGNRSLGSRPAQLNNGGKRKAAFYPTLCYCGVGGSGLLEQGTAEAAPSAGSSDFTVMSNAISLPPAKHWSQQFLKAKENLGRISLTFVGCVTLPDASPFTETKVTQW